MARGLYYAVSVLLLVDIPSCGQPDGAALSAAFKSSGRRSQLLQVRLELRAGQSGADDPPGSYLLDITSRVVAVTWSDFGAVVV
jgi:hypothetical protein